ncbi:MAG: SPOR domain-containing protein, partial [Henriciella sp.]
PSGCGASAPTATAATGDDRDELIRLAAPVLSVSKNVPENFDVNGVYALNLDSSPDPFRDVDLPDNPVFEEYTAYTVTEQENGQTWNRLRLGFFSSRHDAEVAKEDLTDTYPDSWVERTSRQERANVYNAWRAARTLTAGQSSGSAAIDEEAEALLAEARAALTNEDPATAVRLSQSILERPESRVTPQAQELLGLARERAGQLAHAKAEYETYLEKYPSGEAADRVRQRLVVLISGEEGPAVSFAEDGSAVVEEESSLRADISGSISALYQRDQSTIRFEDTPIVGGSEVNPDPIEEDRVNLNEVVYAGDFTASIGNDRMEGLIRFSGVHRDDLRDEDPQDQSSISSLFMELSDRELGLTFRAGRQTRNTGGVFGRFDGALFSAEPTDWLRLNFVGGSPVQRSRDLFVQDDRRFIGTSVDLTLLDEKLETTLYYLTQEWGELKDRESVGAEFRYFDAKNSAFGVLDYDTHYGEVNLALLSGTRRFEDNSSINLALDFRRSPLLTTYNSVIGQGVEDPNDLFAEFTEEEIYQLANDRSATSRSAIVNFSKPLSENYQLNFDITATETSATETSGGVIGFPATG